MIRGVSVPKDSETRFHALRSETGNRYGGRL